MRASNDESAVSGVNDPTVREVVDEVVLVENEPLLCHGSGCRRGEAAEETEHSIAGFVPNGNELVPPRQSNQATQLLNAGLTS